MWFNNSEELTAEIVKSNLQYFPVAANEVWRLDIVNELISVRKCISQIQNISKGNVNEIFEFICSS